VLSATHHGAACSERALALLDDTFSPSRHGFWRKRPAVVGAASAV
jgi:hypothetical protein